MKLMNGIKMFSVVFFIGAFSSANAQYLKPSIDGSWIIDNCGSKDLLLDNLVVIPQSKYFKTIASNYLLRIKIVQYFKPSIDGSWLINKTPHYSKSSEVFFS